MEYPEFRPETRKWLFWCARIFGKRMSAKDGDTEVVMYYWRGKLWAVNKRWRRINLKEALTRNLR